MRAAAAAFVGELEQVPSAVSAIKVDGKRAYARVRAGEEVELAPRNVTVHELVVHDVRLGDDVVDVDLRVRCSSGTYIRAIARDLGAALGVGGHLTALRRTAVGPYDLAVARTLDDLAEGFAVLPLAEAARAGFRAVELTDEQAADVRVGRALDLDLPGLTAVFDPAGEFLALYEPRDGRARAVAVFVAERPCHPAGVKPYAVGHLDEPASGPRGPGLVKVRGWVVGVGTPVLRVRGVLGDMSTTLATHFARPDVAAAFPARVPGWPVSKGGSRLTVVAHACRRGRRPRRRHDV